MSSALLRLEIFETAQLEDETGLFNAHEAEKLRETAFEQGYASGWQDALQQFRNEDALRRAAAEEAIQAVNFTYTEAHQALQTGFLTLTHSMLQKVMPEVARAALPQCLQEELADLITRQTHLPLEILCAPSVLTTLEPIIEATPNRDIRLITEPSFSEAQVALRLGECERIIDLDAVQTRLQALLQTHFKNHAQQEAHHG
ncbi:MAG: hypothetical protein ACXIUW_13000 [Roseinatronobacter sp.]